MASISAFKMLNGKEYCVKSAKGCIFAKCASILYFHTAPAAEGHRGHSTGTFVQGDLGVPVAAC